MAEFSAVRPIVNRDNQREVYEKGGLSLRGFSASAPEALFIGASTGGPQALSALLTALAPHLQTVPVFVVLHMPVDFTLVIARQIERLVGRRTIVANNGEAPCPGSIYFAPGGMHMRLMRFGPSLIIGHRDSPPENFCKPSVDVLFRSAAEAYGPSALGLILTGMGTDGLAGSQAIVTAGGTIIAQDEASSVVWGMPGAVARAGLASAILPPADIAVTVAVLLNGVPPRGAA
jgi:two-component system chemotaxis response regulator CheB